MLIIRRETQRDRERRVYERAAPRGVHGPIEGIARTVDEANDLTYHQHGETQAAYVVEGGPEHQQMRRDDAKHAAEVTGGDQDKIMRDWGIK